jgi:hypothetical protein
LRRKKSVRRHRMSAAIHAFPLVYSLSGKDRFPKNMRHDQEKFLPALKTVVPY